MKYWTTSDVVFQQQQQNVVVILTPLFLLYNQPPAQFLLNAVTEGLGEISPSLYWEGPGSTTALPRLFFFKLLAT